MNKDELVTRLTAIRDMSENVTTELGALVEDVNAYEPTPPNPEPPTTSVADPSMRWGGKELPESVRRINADDRDTAIRKCNEAQPGDHIMIPRGLDLQSFTMTSKGTKDLPVVLRYKEDLPDPTGGPVANLTLAGEHCIAWGINIKDRKLSVNGKNNVVRRTLIANGDYIEGSKHGAAAVINGKDCFIEYFDMYKVRGRGIRTETNARGGGVLHGYIHDFVVEAKDQVYEPVQIGEGANTFRAVTDPAQGFMMGWCYAVNCNQKNGENETPSTKWPFVVIAYCHLHNAKNIQLRFARNTKVICVRVAGNGFFGIQGPDHYFENCVAENNTGFRFFRGNWDSDKAGNPPSGEGGAPAQYPSVLRPVMTGCKGNVEIGYKPDDDCNIRVQGVKIHGMQGGEIRNTQGGDQAWTKTDEPLVPVVAPPVYDPTSQGLMVPCKW